MLGISLRGDVVGEASDKSDAINLVATERYSQHHELLYISGSLRMSSGIVIRQQEL
jgi:hypothetical protein